MPSMVIESERRLSVQLRGLKPLSYDKPFHILHLRFILYADLLFLYIHNNRALII